jgi:predicted ATP-dependent endonuclease of OLD family
MHKLSLLVCEGETDKVILSRLAIQILSEHGVKKDIEVIPAYGRGIIPRMLRALEARYAKVPIVVVVDSEGNEAKVRAEFRTKANWHRHSLVIANPSVESWIHDAKKSGKSGGRHPEGNPVDLHSIERTHPEFKDFTAAMIA